jgi:hypothetical protein
MNTISGNFLETSIPNNNATITLNIAGKESTMNFVDFVKAISVLLAIPNLQQVTESGSLTTRSIKTSGNIEANIILAIESLKLPSSHLNDIATSDAESITRNSIVTFTIDGFSYKIEAQRI